jgi:hypothetical protein
VKLLNNNYFLLKKIVKKEPLFPKHEHETLFGYYPQNQDQIQTNNRYYDERFSSLSDEIRTTNNITYISNSVRDVFDCDVKVATKLWDLRDEVVSETGLLILSKRQSYLYKINNNSIQHIVEIEIFSTLEDSLMSYTKLSYEYDNEIMQIYNQVSFDCMEGSPGYHITFPVQVVVTFLLFKEFAELEIKTIKKGKNSKTKLNNTDYETAVDIPINIIDSTWFTTLIKTDSFKVRGHFRLQPYGTGNRDKRLIWIEEFEKHGIVRQAKMLKK